MVRDWKGEDAVNVKLLNQSKNTPSWCEDEFKSQPFMTIHYTQIMAFEWLRGEAVKCLNPSKVTQP
eukprot:scaffold205097_cov38-Cyclotella_meneghiniana.AAC.1